MQSTMRHVLWCNGVQTQTPTFADKAEALHAYSASSRASSSAANTNMSCSSFGCDRQQLHCLLTLCILRFTPMLQFLGR